MIGNQLRQLLYETLETELGNVDVYTTALLCAVNTDLKEEWQKYLEQTKNHVQVVLRLFDKLKLDPEEETPGRHVVRHIGESLVEAMELALSAGIPETAQLVAAERIVEAETKDHLNWDLLSLAADQIHSPEGRVIHEAVQEVEDEKDKHLFRAAGWSRELWLQSLGLPAMVPPPEDVEKKFKTAAGSGHTRHRRKPMIN